MLKALVFHLLELLESTSLSKQLVSNWLSLRPYGEAEHACAEARLLQEDLSCGPPSYFLADEINTRVGMCNRLL